MCVYIYIYTYIYIYIYTYKYIVHSNGLFICSHASLICVIWLSVICVIWLTLMWDVTHLWSDGDSCTQRATKQLAGGLGGMTLTCKWMINDDTRLLGRVSFEILTVMRYCRTYEPVKSHIWMSHATRMNTSCHTYECVMPHMWLSHALICKEWILRNVNESRSTCKWVTVYM